MDNLLKNLFEKSKAEFYEILKDNNNKKLFELIEQININNTHNYFQILYNIFNFHSNFEYNIHEHKDFSYIIDMIDFLHDIEYCIDDDGELYFIRFEVQHKYDECFLNKLQNINILNALKKSIFMYSFSSRQFESDELIKKDFLKHYDGYNILTIEKISVNYEKLLNILEEILKDENWECKPNKLSNINCYFFNEKKAFDKYF